MQEIAQPIALISKITNQLRHLYEQQGYSQSEVDQYLGWVITGSSTQQFQTAVSNLFSSNNQSTTKTLAKIIARLEGELFERRNQWFWEDLEMEGTYESEAIIESGNLEILEEMEQYKSVEECLKEREDSSTQDNSLNDKDLRSSLEHLMMKTRILRAMLSQGYSLGFD